MTTYIYIYCNRQLHYQTGTVGLVFFVGIEKMLKTQTEGLLNSYFNRAFYCGASLMWPFALENRCFGKHLKAFHVQDLRAFHVQDLKAIHVHCAGGPRDAEGAGVWPPSPRRRSLPEFRASPSCVLACHQSTPFLNAFELSRGEVRRGDQKK